MGATCKVMLVTKKLDPFPTGGRELLCKLNYNALSTIFGSRLVLYELDASPVQGMGALLEAVRGHIDGLTTETMDKAIDLVRSAGITKVFLDGSNLGAFASLLKKRCPGVESVVFFHNVEARFFWGSLRRNWNLRSLAVLMVNYIAERLAVRHSDKRICLSQRDSLLLKRLYGRAATHTAPMAMEDRAPAGFPNACAEFSQSMMLFVGGTFYANQVGIAWFVKNVVPKIDVPVCIVGKGFENHRAALEVPGKVQVIGGVDDLSQWYQKAKFVIAPIFDGSGMKTKVAEALMYGKRVVGTPEAFSGYEDIVAIAGWSCRTVDEFVNAIGVAWIAVEDAFDPALRKLYEDRYSLSAARSRLREIMQ